VTSTSRPSLHSRAVIVYRELSMHLSPGGGGGGGGGVGNSGSSRGELQ